MEAHLESESLYKVHQFGLDTHRGWCFLQNSQLRAVESQNNTTAKIGK